MDSSKTPEVTPVVPPCRVRWRIIPVVTLALFGSLWIAGGLFLLAGMAYASWTGHKLTALSPPGYETEGLFAGLCVLFFGCCSMAAARLCWKGRWRAAIAAVVFVIAGFTAVALLS